MQEDEILDEMKKKNQNKLNDKNADKETILNVKIEDKDIIIEHKNLH